MGLLLRSHVETLATNHLPPRKRGKPDEIPKSPVLKAPKNCLINKA